jgi:hypothetical protein
VTLSTRLYVLPKLVLSGAAPPHAFLVIVLFIDYGLFNRTVASSISVPAVPCLYCTTTTSSRSIEPGAFCPGAVWLGLSGKHAAWLVRGTCSLACPGNLQLPCYAISRSNCTKRQLTLFVFCPSVCLSVCLSVRPSVCLSVCLSACPSLSYNSACTRHIFVKLSTGDILSNLSTSSSLVKIG